MTKKTLQVLLNIAKIALTFYILWLIISQINWKEMQASLSALPYWVLALVVALSALRHLGQYFIWRWALQINPLYELDRREQLSSYLIGLPLRFVLPGGGASLGKVLFVRNSSRWASVLAFVWEKGFLTWGTWSFGFLAVLLFYPDVHLWLRLAALAFCFTAPLWTYFLIGLRHRSRPLQRGFLRYAPRMSVTQLLISLLTLVQYWLILDKLLPVGFWDSLVRMSLTQFSNSIPITFAGLGLRESFAIHFLKDLGYSASQAVSATLIVFLIQDVLPALIGLEPLNKARQERAGAANGGD